MLIEASTSRPFGILWVFWLRFTALIPSHCARFHGRLRHNGVSSNTAYYSKSVFLQHCDHGVSAVLLVLQCKPYSTELPPSAHTIPLSQPLSFRNRFPHNSTPQQAHSMIRDDDHRLQHITDGPSLAFNGLRVAADVSLSLSHMCGVGFSECDRSPDSERSSTMRIGPSAGTGGVIERLIRRIAIRDASCWQERLCGIMLADRVGKVTRVVSVMKYSQSCRYTGRRRAIVLCQVHMRSQIGPRIL